MSQPEVSLARCFTAFSSTDDNSTSAQRRSRTARSCLAVYCPAQLECAPVEWPDQDGHDTVIASVSQVITSCFCGMRPEDTTRSPITNAGVPVIG